MSVSDGVHIPIPQLWEAFSKSGPSLPEAESLHLQDCEHCKGILFLCHTSETLDQVQLKLKSQQRTHS
jgi:hypothetical protein